MFVLVAMMLPLLIKFNLINELCYFSDKCYFLRKILEKCWFKKKKKKLDIEINSFVISISKWEKVDNSLSTSHCHSRLPRNHTVPIK